jgi:hypothetical protein
MRWEKFSLLAATWFNISTLVNKNKLKNSLKSHPEYFINTWLSVWAWFSSQEDARWVYFEGHIW